MNPFGLFFFYYQYIISRVRVICENRCSIHTYIKHPPAFQYNRVSKWKIYKCSNIILCYYDILRKYTFLFMDKDITVEVDHLNILSQPSTCSLLERELKLMS